MDAGPDHAAAALAPEERGRAQHLQRARTFPGILPILHLDHIYFDDKLDLKRLAVHRTRTALMASDHLPLVADFALPTAERPLLNP